jgi:hypothetical protein
MKKEKEAIEEYQCSGCVVGGDTSCYEPSENGGVGCSKHHAGTFSATGNFYLGLPKGFCRLGEFRKMKPNIFKTFESSSWDYDKWNIPAWKYRSENGHVLVRGLMPRINEPFLHIFLEDCMDKINCLEITQKDIDEMD